MINFVLVWITYKFHSKIKQLSQCNMVYIAPPQVHYSMYVWIWSPNVKCTVLTVNTAAIYLERARAWMGKVICASGRYLHRLHLYPVFYVAKFHTWTSRIAETRTYFVNSPTASFDIWVVAPGDGWVLGVVLGLIWFCLAYWLRFTLLLPRFDELR